MKKIRIGNTIKFRFKLTTAPEVELSEIPICVAVVPGNQSAILKDILINGVYGIQHRHPAKYAVLQSYVVNVDGVEYIEAVWEGAEQKHIGIYNIIVYLNRDTNNQFCGDQEGAVQLVAHSWEADTPADDTCITIDINLTIDAVDSALNSAAGGMARFNGFVEGYIELSDSPAEEGEIVFLSTTGKFAMQSESGYHLQFPKRNTFYDKDDNVRDDMLFVYGTDGYVWDAEEQTLAPLCKKDYTIIQEEHLMIVTDEDDNAYACPITPYETPSMPYLPVLGPFISTGAPSVFTITNNTNGANVYYTTDGGDPRTSATAKNGTQVSLAVDLSVESTDYIVKAAAKRNGLWSDVSEQVYTTKRQVMAPTFSVGGEEYDSSRTVTISTVTDGATIMYCTDGYSPTTEGISVTFSSTLAAGKLKAKAAKEGWVDSDVAIYNASIPVGSPQIHYGMSAETTLTSLSSINPAGSKRQKTAKGLSLTVTNDASSKYFYLVVPSGYTLPASFAMSGYGFTPIQGTLTEDGVTYRTYRTPDPQSIGSLTITTA